MLNKAKMRQSFEYSSHPIHFQMLLLNRSLTYEDYWQQFSMNQTMTSQEMETTKMNAGEINSRLDLMNATVNCEEMKDAKLKDCLLFAPRFEFHNSFDFTYSNSQHFENRDEAQHLFPSSMSMIQNDQMLRILDEEAFTYSNCFFHNSKSTIDNIENEYSFENSSNELNSNPFDTDISIIEENCVHMSDHDYSGYNSFIQNSLEKTKQLKIDSGQEGNSTHNTSDHLAKPIDHDNSE